MRTPKHRMTLTVDDLKSLRRGMEREIESIDSEIREETNRTNSADRLAPYFSVRQEAKTLYKRLDDMISASERKPAKKKRTPPTK